MKNLLSLATLTAVLLYASITSASATTIAGGGSTPPEVGLDAISVDVGEIYSSKVDNNGNLYLVREPYNSSLWVIRVNKWGKIDRLYENQTIPIDYFDDICIDSAGNIFLPAFDEHVVYKVTPEGNASIYAGNGTYGYSGDGGPATSAQLERPESITVDLNGNVYVSHSSSNPVIRKITQDGTITTYFDGTDLGIQYPDALFVDNYGNLYFYENSQNKVYKVSQGVTTEIASLPGSSYGVTGDKYGNIFYTYYYYDSGTSTPHYIVKKRDPFGIETTLADDIDPSDYPSRLSTDMDGMLYINTYKHPSGSSVDKLTFAPAIGTITPLDAAPGERVTISGRYFASNGIGGSVTFGGISAPIHSWSNDMIVCDIPAGTSKTVNVVVTTADGQTSTPFSYRLR